jgi:hypothetical protein
MKIWLWNPNEMCLQGPYLSSTQVSEFNHDRLCYGEARRAVILSVENCMVVDRLILLNYHNQDGVENVYELIEEYKQIFKHLFSDLRIAAPFWHAPCIASASLQKWGAPQSFSLPSDHSDGSWWDLSVRPSPILARFVVWPGRASAHRCRRPQIHSKRTRAETRRAQGFNSHCPSNCRAAAAAEARSRCSLASTKSFTEVKSACVGCSWPLDTARAFAAAQFAGQSLANRAWYLSVLFCWICSSFASLSRRSSSLSHSIL